MAILNKNQRRLRRAFKTRRKINELGAYRLSVFKSARHIYAQLFSTCGNQVLAAASTRDGALQSEVSFGGNISAAQVVGKAIAEKIKSAGIQRIAFDRSGYPYHGRVKALADALRDGGIEF